MDKIVAFFHKLGPEMLDRTYEHIFLTFFSVVIAVLIALPLGIYLTKCRWKSVATVVLASAGIVQTVPGLALISFIVAIFALIALPTIGAVPALIALSFYALLPILRNTYTGIRQVDASSVEAALGMGMKPGQILLHVEMPLALPFIMAGIRIATVWTIGIATLCGLIGAGGLGDLIIKGLRSMQIDYLLAGTFPAAALALVFDGTLALLEKWLSPHNIRAV